MPFILAEGSVLLELVIHLHKPDRICCWEPMHMQDVVENCRKAEKQHRVQVIAALATHRPIGQSIGHIRHNGGDVVHACR